MQTLDPLDTASSTSTCVEHRDTTVRCRLLWLLSSCKCLSVVVTELSSIAYICCIYFEFICHRRPRVRKFRINDSSTSVNIKLSLVARRASHSKCVNIPLLSPANPSRPSAVSSTCLCRHAELMCQSLPGSISTYIPTIKTRPSQNRSHRDKGFVWYYRIWDMMEINGWQMTSARALFHKAVCSQAGLRSCENLHRTSIKALRTKVKSGLAHMQRGIRRVKL